MLCLVDDASRDESQRADLGEEIGASVSADSSCKLRSGQRRSLQRRRNRWRREAALARQHTCTDEGAATAVASAQHGGAVTVPFVYMVPVVLSMQGPSMPSAPCASSCEGVACCGGSWTEGAVGLMELQRQLLAQEEDLGISSGIDHAVESVPSCGDECLHGADQVLPNACSPCVPEAEEALPDRTSGGGGDVRESVHSCESGVGSAEVSFKALEAAAMDVFENYWPGGPRACAAGRQTATECFGLGQRGRSGRRC